MAKKLYPSARRRVFQAGFHWVSDNFDVLLLPSTYVYDSTDEFISDLGTITARLALAGKTNTDGVLDADNATLLSVAAGSVVGSVVIAKNTGSDASSPLLLWDDTVLGLPYTTDGNNILIPWSDGPNKILNLPEAVTST